MTHDATAKLHVTGSARDEHEFVKMGMGPEDNGLRIASPVEYVEDLLYRFLDTNGDGTGTKDANGNYSVTPAKFFIRAPAETFLVLYTMTINVEDNVALTQAGYGGSVGPLTNGVNVYIANENEVNVLSLVDGRPIKANPQWQRIAHDIRTIAYSGAANGLTISWEFQRTGSPILLRPFSSLVVALSDDFSHLTDHAFLIAGHQHHA